MMEQPNRAADPLTTSGRDQAPRGISPALIGAAVLAVLAIAFFFQNGGRTRIWLLFFSFTSKTRTAIIVAMLLGVLIDRLAGRWWHNRRAHRKG